MGACCSNHESKGSVIDNVYKIREPVQNDDIESNHREDDDGDVVPNMTKTLMLKDRMKGYNHIAMGINLIETTIKCNDITNNIVTFIEVYWYNNAPKSFCGAEVKDIDNFVYGGCILMMQ